jgi:hypothetical protein
MFLQWCGDVLPKVHIFVQRFVSGTGRGFGSAPLKKHKRCAQLEPFRVNSVSPANFGDKSNDKNREIDVKMYTDNQCFISHIEN